MKKIIKRFVCALLAAGVLCGSTFSSAAYTKFDFIVDIAQEYGLDMEDTDLLREYFNEFLEKNPQFFGTLVNGILSLVDSHSAYYTAEEYNSGFDLSADNYVGIGVGIQNTAYGVTISNVAIDSPAEKAGILEGDVIVKINDTYVGGHTLQEVSDMLRGETGTSIFVTIRRNGKETQYLMSRADMTKSQISVKDLGGRVKYIKYAGLGYATDIERFKTVWTSLENDGTQGVILDLRGNLGGQINAALEVLNRIIPDKDVHYMSLRYREELGGIQDYRSQGIGKKMEEIVVLVDEDTASAAEMVAGSLQDLGYATLVGNQTYGKGVGQMHIGMVDGTYVSITSLEMLLPKTGGYEGVGLTPDIHISNSSAKNNYAYLKAMDTRKPLYYATSSTTIGGLNQRLLLLGYDTYDMNYYSTRTRSAVRQFQRDNGLPQTDYCDTATLKKIAEKTEQLKNTVVQKDLQLDIAEALCRDAVSAAEKTPVDDAGTQNGAAA